MSGTQRKQADSTRSNLRLAPHVWTGIDAARSRRPGNVSRNTWITEAILEKLGREKQIQNDEAPKC
jgi:hypothetical protein